MKNTNVINRIEKKPDMLSPKFIAKVREIRTQLAKKDVKGAIAALDEAWTIAGNHKPSRTQAHALGNQIQAVIFELHTDK